MSFIKDVKDEIISFKIENDCCALAFIAGVLYSSANIKQKEDDFEISFVCDNMELFHFIDDLVEKHYGSSLIIKRDDSPLLNKQESYLVSFPGLIAKQVLLDCFLISPIDFKIKGRDNFEEFLKEECCESNFVKGVFLMIATSSIKLSEKAYEKSTSGYHMEFTSHDYNFLNSLSKVLANKGILAKLVERKKQFVLYLKEAQLICDLLTFVQAYNSVLALQNEIVAREMRNAVNRQTNCLSANISKTVSANMKQLEAIDIIDSTIGIEALPQELQDVVLLRLANTEESLSELARLNPNLTKSGLNHRFRKLISLANELKD